MIKAFAKSCAVNSLASMPYRCWPMSVRGRYIPIFMMHRFECKDVGVDGHPVALVKQAFEYLRKSRIDIVSVEEAILLSKSGEILNRPVVAFSIDDGYWDHFEVGLELFKQYDCPATYFVSTEIVENNLWMWDSKLMYLVDVAIGQGKLKFIMNMFGLVVMDKESVVEAIVKDLKLKAYDLIQEKIDEIARFLGVIIPEHPPEKYRFMSWSDIRSVEKQGMQVGPHSANHYILSSLEDEQAKYEVEKSWFDLKQQLKRPSPVFCYPVGKSSDYGEREKRIVAGTEMIGAVTASPGALSIEDTDYFEIPRYSFPEKLVDFKQYATWIEEYKQSFKKL